MEIEECLRKSGNLVKRHLPGWRLVMTNHKVAMGQCDYNQKHINISQYIILSSTWKECKDVILHEIAHALTPKQHHNKIWKEACVLLGARPSTTVANKTSKKIDTIVPHNYVYKCPNCDYEVRTFRRRKVSKKRACGKCCNKYNHGKWTKKYLLQGYKIVRTYK